MTGPGAGSADPTRGPYDDVSDVPWPYMGTAHLDEAVRQISEALVKGGML